MHLPIGTILQGGKYRIVRYINSGGFGCTYEAEHVMLGERVAIKEFYVKDFCDREEGKHVAVGTKSKIGLIEKLKCKFIEEAKMLYRIQHPGIVRVFDIFEENGTAYYVMDYIDGHSLSEVVAESGTLPEKQVLHYIHQVAEALQYVHNRGCLHLDIKPGNIMVDKSDNAILIDFGVSKQYDEVDGENTSTLIGKTPGYAPIEQMGNSVVTFSPSTDIYALGATMYKLLTGETPNDATRLLNEGLPELPSSISAQVRNAIMVSMKPIRKDRPQSIKEFESILYAPNIGDIKSTGYRETIAESDEGTIIVNDSTVDVGSIEDTDKQKFSKIRDASADNKQTANFKQYVKSISAKCFIMFLVIHLIIAFLSVIDTFRGTFGLFEGLFLAGCDFMGISVISLFNILLSIGFVVYIVLSITSQITNIRSNNQIRTSKSLIALGIIILGLLVFHLNHFWANMQLKDFFLAEHAENPYVLLYRTFQTWWMVVFYTLWIATLGFYIVNDFENILKVTGWDNKIRIIKDEIVKPKTIAYTFSIILCLGFIAVAINAYMHANRLII